MYSHNGNASITAKAVANAKFLKAEAKKRSMPTISMANAPISTLQWKSETNDNMNIINAENMCSHLQKKLFEPNGIYHPIWQALQNQPEISAVVRARQLHIYRNGKKFLILAGKAKPKVLLNDPICQLLPPDTQSPQ